MNINNISQRLEASLWLVGLVCIAIYAGTKVDAARAQAAATASLELQWQTIEPDQSLWSEHRIRRYKEARDVTDGLTPLGLVSIPRVGIQVAVFDGTTDKVLNVGAGRVPGTAQFGHNGNLAIAAHRDGFFRPLKYIGIGDVVVLQSSHGKRKYVVSETLVVDPDHVSVLEPTQTPTVTLITCYPFYFLGNAPQRFIVRATLKPVETGS